MNVPYLQLMKSLLASAIAAAIGYAVSVLLLPVLYVVWLRWREHEMQILVECAGGMEETELE